MKFSHIADCHLGGWRYPELQSLNFESFKKAIDISIEEKVDFVLITGDLFDSAYPPIDILAECFFQLKRLKDNSIDCYIIAGSHDFSASGKTFLYVLEKAGFCKSCFKKEEKNNKIILHPIIHKNVAIYGYPGKKSSLEIEELKRVSFNDAPGLFKIFALHTSIKGAIKDLPIEAISEEDLPKADYYALGHLHIHYQYKNFVYAGPTFPNNFQELEELKYGSFCIVNTDPLNIRRILLKIKDVEIIDLLIDNTLTAADIILKELDKRDIANKIVLLKLRGTIKNGNISDINFKEIEDKIKRKGGYAFLRNISKLQIEESKIDVEIQDIDKLEEEIIKKYQNENKKFSKLIPLIINSLSIEKNEGETNNSFSERLFLEVNKILEIK
ncbi:MAG: metallophosphoesterase [Candidatus Pacearchaeota archaeon]